MTWATGMGQVQEGVRRELGLYSTWEYKIGCTSSLQVEVLEGGGYLFELVACFQNAQEATMVPKDSRKCMS